MAKSRYTRERYLQLLRDHAELVWSTTPEGQRGGLLTNAHMVDAIREEIWQPPDEPASAAATGRRGSA